MSNVYSYIRVSSRGQISGDGPERQRESIYAFCSGKGVKILSEKFEAGVSGTTEALDRPAFSEMIDEIGCRRLNGEEVDGFVVERMDRIARDLMVQEFLLAECRKRDIKVFAADQGAWIDMASNGGDPTRKLIRQILGALAEWEKTQLVLKLKKARVHKKIATGRCEGNTPFGSGGVAEKQIIMLLKSWESLNLSNANVAKMLNDGGFTTRFGKQFNRFSVDYYRGMIKQGKVVE